MKKRRKNRISRFGFCWQIWYPVISSPIAYSRVDERPLLPYAEKCSGILWNPPEYSEFVMFGLMPCCKLAHYSQSFFKLLQMDSE